MPAQVNLNPEPEIIEGLRARKKVKTRLAIEEAAISLFNEQGYDSATVEQISERAEISATTFFRYFPSKADVILCRQDSQLPVLHRAMLERPASEDELTVVRRAIQTVWVPGIDPERTRRTANIISNSPVLRGMYDDMNRDWVQAISEALAQRKPKRAKSGESRIAARVAVAIFGDSVETWISGNCREDLCKVLDRHFEIVARLTTSSS